MNVKYFQPLAHILSHYNMIMTNMEDTTYGHMFLKTWGISVEDREDILEEREVLRYLVDCKTEIADETNVKKPSLEAVRRCFNRHLAFIEKHKGCHKYNVNKHKSVLVRKEYKACRHYLFQFSLPAWYAKLPDEIVTFDNTYPDFKNKYNILD